MRILSGKSKRSDTIFSILNSRRPNCITNFYAIYMCNLSLTYDKLDEILCIDEV